LLGSGDGVDDEAKVHRPEHGALNPEAKCFRSLALMGLKGAAELEAVHRRFHVATILLGSV